MVLIEIFWAIGAAFEVVLAYLLMDNVGWRGLLAVSAVPCAIFIMACVVG